MQRVRRKRTALTAGGGDYGGATTLYALTFNEMDKELRH